MGRGRYFRVELVGKWVENRAAKVSAACCGVNLAAEGWLFCRWSVVGDPHCRSPNRHIANWLSPIANRPFADG
jgi:hypothetical protein